MKINEFIEIIVKQIVDYPDDVKIKMEEFNSYTFMELSVNKLDLGIVIGRNGDTIKAIRIILRSFSGKNEHQYLLEINQG